MENLGYLILLDGEFRSLIRNTFERIIGNRFKKEEDPMKEIAKKLSIRVVSSLLAVQLYYYLQTSSPEMKTYVSFGMIAVFIYFILEENKQHLN
jgi:hypothetical protein